MKTDHEKAGETKKFFYQLSIKEAATRLDTDLEKGLSSEQAAKRLEEYGPNQLKDTVSRPMILRFLDQFKDLLIVVLIVAALLAYYLGDFRGGTILLIIVFVNAIIGFYQEFKAEKILDSLKSFIKDNAVVIRDGQRMEVEQHTLVPGDLVYLEEGASIPADIRLTKSHYIATNDFVLTGESVPKEKFAEMVIDHETTVTDQDNLVFMGLTVAKGSAYGLVYGTGMDTAIGRIAKATQEITQDASPLQREFNSLAKTLTKLAGIIAVLLFLINFLLNMNNGESMSVVINTSIIFAIGVAAACVPQGLPAQVSVALSLGVGRLAKNKAIVKKLSSVEGLGSTTVICSDKTGTITKNEMTITHAVAFEKEGKSIHPRVFDVTGEGYNPEGKIHEEGKDLKKEDLDHYKQFFTDGFLASNGRVVPPDAAHSDWYAIGDPTEAAFSPLVLKAGFESAELDEKFPMVNEIGFDSERKRMTIIREHKGNHIGYMKGAIESVLSVSHKINVGGELIDLDEKMKKLILEQAEHYSSQALRVIALAYRDFPKDVKEFTIEGSEKEFVFVGFAAMMDPPKVGVKEAIEASYLAGIRIMMITGDNAITARAIAGLIGMNNGDKELPAYIGDEVKAMSDEKLKEILLAKSVIFSRVSPEDKYRIVTLLKEMDEVVAVTGDGVNDTLSLKKADIGVAMGKVGSEVAKQASDIVLLDDNFKTLTKAISEGRAIFANLKKTILSTLTSNNGELFCVLIGFVGIAMGLPAPITAVQILAIDLIGEMLPLTALTFDSTEKSVMNRPPRKMDDHIINLRSYMSIAFFGLVMGATGYVTFYMLYHVLGTTVETARAGTYVGIMFCQFANVLSRRSENSIFNSYTFTNPYLWGSFLFSATAIALLVYVPAISIWFGFEPLAAAHFIYPIAGACILIIFHEIRKMIMRRRHAVVA